MPTFHQLDLFESEFYLNNAKIGFNLGYLGTQWLRIDFNKNCK